MLKKNGPLVVLHQFRKRVNNAVYETRQKRDHLLLKEASDSTMPLAFSDAPQINGLPQVTIVDAVTHYVENILPRRVSLNRARADANILIRFCNAVGHSSIVCSMSSTTLSDFRDLLARQSLSNMTINRYMQIVGAFLRSCHDLWNLVELIPRLRPYPISSKLIYLSEEGESKLLAAAPARLKVLLIFMLGTGARPSEATNLTWDDVTFNTPGRRSWVVFPATKNGRPHSVPLPENVRSMLIELKTNRDPSVPYVFTYKPQRGYRDEEAGNWRVQRDVTTRYIRGADDLNRIKGALGLDHVNLYTMRHTYASRLVSKGVPLENISKLMNHCNFEQTRQYAHLSASDLEASIDVLDVKPLALAPLSSPGLPVKTTANRAPAITPFERPASPKGPSFSSAYIEELSLEELRRRVLG